MRFFLLLLLPLAMGLWAFVQKPRSLEVLLLFGRTGWTCHDWRIFGVFAALVVFPHLSRLLFVFDIPALLVCSFRVVSS